MLQEAWKCHQVFAWLILTENQHPKDQTGQFFRQPGETLLTNTFSLVTNTE